MQLWGARANTHGLLPNAVALRVSLPEVCVPQRQHFSPESPLVCRVIFQLL